MHTSVNKTVTVVIPCFKHAQYLPEAIDSVLSQTYPIHELIVVNDGSPDNTSEIVKGYMEKHSNVYLVEKPNGGLASARNAGIAKATGEYIMCLDADDILRPDAVKEHVKLMDNNSVVTCGLMWFGNAQGTYRPKGATLHSLLKGNSVYCNSMFPRWAWEKVKYDESDIMRLGLEDWLFWVELADLGLQFKKNDYIALLYRKHGSNMTTMTTHPNWDKITSYMRNKVQHIIDREREKMRPQG